MFVQIRVIKDLLKLCLIGVLVNTGKVQTWSKWPAITEICIITNDADMTIDRKAKANETFTLLPTTCPENYPAHFNTICFLLFLLVR